LPAFVPIVPMGEDACGGERAGPGGVLVRLAGAEVAVSRGVDAALLTVVLRAVRASKA
jgi:transposase